MSHRFLVHDVIVAVRPIGRRQGRPQLSAVFRRSVKFLKRRRPGVSAAPSSAAATPALLSLGAGFFGAASGVEGSEWPSPDSDGGSWRLAESKSALDRAGERQEGGGRRRERWRERCGAEWQSHLTQIMQGAARRMKGEATMRRMEKPAKMPTTWGRRRHLPSHIL